MPTGPAGPRKPSKNVAPVSKSRGWQKRGSRSAKVAVLFLICAFLLRRRKFSRKNESDQLCHAAHYLRIGTWSQELSVEWKAGAPRWSQRTLLRQKCTFGHKCVHFTLLEPKCIFGVPLAKGILGVMGFLMILEPPGRPISTFVPLGHKVVKSINFCTFEAKV